LPVFGDEVGHEKSQLETTPARGCLATVFACLEIVLG